MSFQLSPEKMDLYSGVRFASNDLDGWPLEMSYSTNMELISSFTSSTRKMAVDEK